MAWRHNIAKCSHRRLYTARSSGSGCPGHGRPTGRGPCSFSCIARYDSTHALRFVVRLSQSCSIMFPAAGMMNEEDWEKPYESFACSEVLDRVSASCACSEVFDRTSASCACGEVPDRVRELKRCNDLLCSLRAGSKNGYR